MAMHRPLIPEFSSTDVREDWQSFAMLAPSQSGPFGHWSAADLAGIGDTESAADLFDTLYFGA